MMTLRRLVRGIRGRAGLGARWLAALTGVELHRASESRAYWEERGHRYLQEVDSILHPEDPYFLAQQQFLVELAAIDWSSILEVGCGFGWHLKAVTDRFPGRRVAGLDFSFAQLSEGRRYLAGSRALACQASAFRLPFPDESFDVVFTSGMLVCLHPEQFPLAMAELTRVARRSVIIMEYAREHMDTPERLSVMRTAEWHGHLYRAALEAAELKVVNSYAFPSFDSDRARVPLSFFLGTKIGSSTILERPADSPPGRL
jgi:SAM-dependent methyltransferase